VPALAALAAVAALGLGAPLPAAPPSQDPYCTQTYGAGDQAQPAPLRFGVDPELAGSAGPTQGTAKPEDQRKRDAALAALRPARRELVLRVNRLFWSDGAAGIQRFRRKVAHDTGLGYDVELQVRYHPTPAQEGDMTAWRAYVRRVVDVFGANPRVIAMTITNEDNISVSPNTSDGAYRGATQALVQGVIAARREADRRGFGRLTFGFTYAWRFAPQSDRALWTALAAGGKPFRRALGFVGVDAYPGSFYPPALAPGQSAGAALVQALATVRDCWMPMASLGAGVPIWITENGYPTTPVVHSAAEQAAALGSMVDAAHAYAGTYGVTDYRWFNLRDNDSSGTGMFDTDGLLRDDYTPKPAFDALRRRIASFGASRAQPSRKRGRTG